MEVIQILKSFLKSYFTANLTNRPQLRQPNSALLAALSFLSFVMGLLSPGMQAIANPENLDGSLQIHFQQPDTEEESTPQDRPQGGDRAPPVPMFKWVRFPAPI